VIGREVDISGNRNISQVKIMKKGKAPKAQPEDKASGISEQLDALAKKEVAPSEAVPPQKPALSEVIEEPDADDAYADSSFVDEQPVEAAIDAAVEKTLEPAKKPAKKRVTKKPANDAGE